MNVVGKQNFFFCSIESSYGLNALFQTPMDIATDAQDRDLRCILKISQALRKFQPNGRNLASSYWTMYMIDKVN